MILIVLRAVNYKTEIDIGCAEITNCQFDLIKNPKVPRNFTHNHIIYNLTRVKYDSYYMKVNFELLLTENQVTFKIGYHITNMIKSMNKKSIL